MSSNLTSTISRLESLESLFFRLDALEKILSEKYGYSDFDSFVREHEGSKRVSVSNNKALLVGGKEKAVFTKAELRRLQNKSKMNAQPSPAKKAIKVISSKKDINSEAKDAKPVQQFVVTEKYGFKIKVPLEYEP